MVQVLNRARGPRVFNVKSGNMVTQVTLQPGKSADLDLENQDDPVIKAWMDAEEVVVGADAERRMRRDSTGTESRADRMASLRKELAELEAEDRAATQPASAALRAPPAMFGGDGGPEQMPMPGGRSGDPTPAQGEGTAQQKAEKEQEKQGVVVAAPPPKPEPAKPAAPAKR